MTRALLILSLLLLSVAPLLQSPIFAQGTLKASFAHEILVHEHGFIRITEQVSLTNQSPSSTSVASFELHYPKTVSQSIQTYSSDSGIDSIRIQDETDFARIIVTPSGNFALQPGETQTYQVTLLLTDMISERIKDEFFFTLPLAPNINPPVENVSTRIVLPDRSSIIEQPSGFSLLNGSRQVWEGFSQPTLK
ncbi:MAG: hypothetical protein HY619_04010, partial [Thaumarchaeota archaeon]|nr:hypothetical protein [Nitrososphaerota archaeon]